MQCGQMAGEAFLDLLHVLLYFRAWPSFPTVCDHADYGEHPVIDDLWLRRVSVYGTVVPCVPLREPNLPACGTICVVCTACAQTGI